MAEMYQRTHKRVIPSRDRDIEVQETRIEEMDEDAPVSKVQQVVQFISGLFATILGLRFILALFGANASNAIVDFVYTITNPLVAPFRGLFARPDLQTGARFEVETLIAIVAYLLIGLLVIKLVDLFKHNA